MGVITGKDSLVQGDSTVVPTFYEASVSQTINVKELIHAGTAQGRARIDGVEDWDGTYSEYGYEPTFLPGEEITFYESIDGAKGLTGDAIMTQVVITIPVGSQDPPTIVGTFRGIDQLDLTDTTAISEPSAALIAPPKGICVGLSNVTLDSVTYTDEANVHNIVITLSIDVAEFNDCSTNGIMDAIEAGWDASVSYERYIDDFSDLPAVGSSYNVKVPIDSAGTEYYLFDFMKVGEIQDMSVSRQSPDLLSVTVPLMMSMIETVGTSAPTVTKGTGVTLPDTTVWRPT